MEVDAVRAPRKTRSPAAREPDSFSRSTSPLRTQSFELIAFVEDDFGVGRAGSECLIDELCGERWR